MLLLIPAYKKQDLEFAIFLRNGSEKELEELKKMNTNYLKYKMSQKGDSQKEICELLDISQNAFINKMRGKNYFTMREVRLIVERYDLNYEEIKEIFF